MLETLADKLNTNFLKRLDRHANPSLIHNTNDKFLLLGTRKYVGSENHHEPAQKQQDDNNITRINDAAGPAPGLTTRNKKHRSTNNTR